VLRDPRTNSHARRLELARDRPDDAVGLNWLSEQAQGARITEALERGELRRDEAPELMRDEALELMRDALQCATEASWFLLRRLTSRENRYGDVVSKRLEGFARRRGIARTMTER
jgi:hypothetical protein